MTVRVCAPRRNRLPGQQGEQVRKINTVMKSVANTSQRLKVNPVQMQLALLCCKYHTSKMAAHENGCSYLGTSWSRAASLPVSRFGLLNTCKGAYREWSFFFSRSNFDNWLRRATFLSVAGTASLVLRAWVCETKFACHAILLQNPRLAWASAHIANHLKQKPPFRLGGIGMQTLKLLPTQGPSKEKKLKSIQASLVGELDRLIFGNIPRNVLVDGASEAAAASSGRAGAEIAISTLATVLT